MVATAVRLGAVDVKGGLWGADLLAALADDRARLPADTIRPDSYGLPARASTEQAARAAWTVLTAAWEEFTDQYGARVDRDATDIYGDDRFTTATWTRHLMAQLGYTPAENPAGGLVIPSSDGDDDRFPITHIQADQVPLHLLAAGVPLDSRTRGVAGADRQSPHSLVQDYLNRTSAHLWAIVTNGLTLRILRDNAALSRQAHIEFDLAAIFSDGAYADFALLWHAAHATRFAHGPDETPAACIAERWQEHATATGVAALDDLRDGVEAAIAEIGQGLLEHPSNAALRAALDDPDDPFDAAAYYRELLYVAYRHVFWFTLDDRDLLHPRDAERSKVAAYRDHFASSILRGRARAHLGAHHPDGWQHHTTIAGWFADPAGQPALALPGLLGRLWDPAATAHLIGTTLTNRRYYEALRRLSYVTRDGVLQRINYDAMGSEELGAVYESLLEIRPVAEAAARRFTLGRTSGSDRKKTGSYYTPTSLIKVLLDEALDPVLDERLKQAVHHLPAEATPEERARAEEDAILATTICDPAMGSAHFLVAAGMRAAKRLASIRTQEIEPSPEAVQQAFRDVASRSLYGVDINPMAVELAKVAIWLECHVPGQPLTFLDHHLKQGNALLGAGFDPSLVAWRRHGTNPATQKGIPDAAFTVLTGDDKAHARELREGNRRRRGRGGSLRFRSAGAHVDGLDRLAAASSHLTNLADDTADALATKQQAWDDYGRDVELTRQRLRADAWVASWTLPKTREVSKPLLRVDPLSDDDLPWDVYYDTFFDMELDPGRPGVRAVRAEADRLGFFHWYVEFPDVTATGGFSCMLGNPPWERLTPSEQDWFGAAGMDDVANDKRANSRRKKIVALRESADPGDRRVFREFELYLREIEVLSEFARMSGRYERVWARDLNLYALFALNFRDFTAGRAGMLVPTAAITDFGMKDFFAGLVDDRRIVAAYDFENRGKRLFPGVHASFRFVTLITAASGDAPQGRYAFMVHDPAELDDATRTFTLTPSEIALVNPNTKNAPIFLTRREAEITTRVYERHPVLVRHGQADGNPWGISFMRMFDMANSSALFRTANEIHSDGFTLTGNVFERDGERLLPLYEAKMLHLYNHRWATFVDEDTSRDATPDELADPTFEPLPRYWIAGRTVAEKLAEKGWDHRLLFAYRNITNATNERTCVASVLPRVAPSHSCLLIFPDAGPRAQLLLQAALSSYAFDFLARVKMSGTNFIYAIMEQLVVPHPRTFDQSAGWQADDLLGDWVARRSAALAASSKRMARTLGYNQALGWDTAKREIWRTELDAGMFHVYGYSQDEVADVMDKFPIVARKDRQAEELADKDPNWRTKRLILAKYDELARHTAAGTTYESPDPPPALPESLRLRHAAPSTPSHRESGADA